MQIEIEVSDENEATASPWWFISDPQQMMRPDHYQLASMITGPFFSREEAEAVMKKRRHHYSDRVAVFCASVSVDCFCRPEASEEPFPLTTIRC